MNPVLANWWTNVLAPHLCHTGSSFRQTTTKLVIIISDKTLSVKWGDVSVGHWISPGAFWIHVSDTDLNNLTALNKEQSRQWDSLVRLVWETWFTYGEIDRLARVMWEFVVKWEASESAAAMASYCNARVIITVDVLLMVVLSGVQYGRLPWFISVS